VNYIKSWGVFSWSVGQPMMENRFASSEKKQYLFGNVTSSATRSNFGLAYLFIARVNNNNNYYYFPTDHCE